MDDPKKFSPFETTDIKPFIEEQDRAAKSFVSDYDIRPIGSEGFSISVDIQQYVDEAVTKMHNAVKSQVESSLQAILKDAFMLTLEPLRLQPIALEGLWTSFLQKLALAAEVAVDEIEERR